MIAVFDLHSVALFHCLKLSRFFLHPGFPRAVAGPLPCRPWLTSAGCSGVAQLPASHSLRSVVLPPTPPCCTAHASTDRRCAVGGRRSFSLSRLRGGRLFATHAHMHTYTHTLSLCTAPPARASPCRRHFSGPGLHRPTQRLSPPRHSPPRYSSHRLATLRLATLRLATHRVDTYRLATLRLATQSSPRHSVTASPLSHRLALHPVTEPTRSSSGSRPATMRSRPA